MSKNRVFYWGVAVDAVVVQLRVIVDAGGSTVKAYR